MLTIEVLVDARAVFVEQIKKEAAELGINAAMYGMGKAMPEPQYEIAMDAECDLAVYVLQEFPEGADRDVSAGDINFIGDRDPRYFVLQQTL